MEDTQLEKSRFTLEATVDVDFDAEDVARNLKPIQVADLIMELDDEVGEWEHTLYLYHYFAAQYEIAKAKVPELANMTPSELRETMEEAND
jgi:hypothetical protein